MKRRECPTTAPSYFDVCTYNTGFPHTHWPLAIYCILHFGWLLVPGLSSQVSIYFPTQLSPLVKQYLGKWLHDFISFGNLCNMYRIGSTITPLSHQALTRPEPSLVAPPLLPVYRCPRSLSYRCHRHHLLTQQIL